MFGLFELKWDILGIVTISSGSRVALTLIFNERMNTVIQQVKINTNKALKNHESKFK